MLWLVPRVYSARAMDLAAVLMLEILNGIATLVLISAGLGKIVAQALAIALVTPLNFVGNKLWSFRR